VSSVHRVERQIVIKAIASMFRLKNRSKMSCNVLEMCMVHHQVSFIFQKKGRGHVSHFCLFRCDLVQSHLCSFIRLDLGMKGLPACTSGSLASWVGIVGHSGGTSTPLFQICVLREDTSRPLTGQLARMPACGTQVCCQAPLAHARSHLGHVSAGSLPSSASYTASQT